MALTNEEILDAIASKTVLEISELIKMMEDKFGVSAAAAASAAAFDGFCGFTRGVSCRGYAICFGGVLYTL